jgi:hypothetical protein
VLRAFGFISLVAAVLSFAAASVAEARSFPDAPRYEVGFAKRTINPDADGTWDGGTVNLGGYGIGGPPLFEGRGATGVLGRGPDVRAIVVAGRGGVLAIASEQTQGWFAALKNGEPHGLQDMRLEVERRTDGAVPAESVVVQSNHTHSGPDMMGVWGGVPRAYRAFVFEQTVEAIVAAWEQRRRAVLRYGDTPARDLLTNQFDYDEVNQSLDSDLRVLQALDPKSGRPLVTLLNFSAHATVLGASNTKASGDWPQQAAPLLERRLGGRAIVTVATLGRTQPSDRGCPNEALEGARESICALNEYSTRVVDRAARALRDARTLGGPPRVEARSYLVTDIGSNALLLGFEYAGELAGTPLNRSFEPPWFAGNVLSTITSSARIGDLLISSYPGEAYPQIPLDVAGRLEDARAQMTLGVAHDQLGYLIAPYVAYPEPIRRSLFNQRGDEISPIDNDNYFFNVSHTIGERIRCASLRGAGEVFGVGRRYLNADPSCLLFSLDAGRPHGADLR